MESRFERANYATIAIEIFLFIKRPGLLLRLFEMFTYETLKFTVSVEVLQKTR